MSTSSNEYRFTLTTKEVKGLEFHVEHKETINTWRKGGEPTQDSQCEISVTYQGKNIGILSFSYGDEEAPFLFANTLSQALYGLPIERMPLPEPEPETEAEEVANALNA